MSLEWIKIDVGFPSSAQASDLADLLEVDVDLAVGKMVRFWVWCACSLDVKASSRVKSKNPARVVENVANWRGTPGKFVEAAIAVGLLKKEPGGLLVRGWEERYKTRVEKNQRDAVRLSRKRRGDVAEVSLEHRGDIAGPSPGRRRVDEMRLDEMRFKNLAGAVAPPVLETVPETVPPKATADPPVEKPTALKQKKERRKAERPTDPRHAPLFRALCDVFLESTGAKYGANGHDAAEVTQLLSLGEPDEVLGRWMLALRSKFPKVATFAELRVRWNHFPIPAPAAPAEPQLPPVPKTPVQEAWDALLWRAGPSVGAWFSDARPVALNGALEVCVESDEMREKLENMWRRELDAASEREGLPRVEILVAASGGNTASSTEEICSTGPPAGIPPSAGPDVFDEAQPPPVPLAIASSHAQTKRSVAVLSAKERRRKNATTQSH